MKKSKFFIVGLVSAILGSGLFLSGCNNGTTDQRDELDEITSELSSFVLPSNVQVYNSDGSLNSGNDTFDKFVSLVGSDEKSLNAYGLTNRTTNEGILTLNGIGTPSGVFLSSTPEFTITPNNAKVFVLEKFLGTNRLEYLRKDGRIRIDLVHADKNATVRGSNGVFVVDLDLQTGWNTVFDFRNSEGTRKLISHRPDSSFIWTLGN